MVTVSIIDAKQQANQKSKLKSSISHFLKGLDSLTLTRNNSVHFGNTTEAAFNLAAPS